MDLNFQTANGDRIVRVHDADGLVRALDSLTDESTAEIETGAYPPLYASGVRYQRERGEHWRSPARVVCGPDAYGADCEDLTAWRVAELRASGADPDARPALYPTSKRSYHAVVVRGDGTVEDPSAVLGMPTGVSKVGVRLYEGGAMAGFRLADGSVLRAVGVGSCAGLALRDALDYALPALATLPSVPARLPRWADVGSTETDMLAAAADAAVPGAGLIVAQVAPFIDKAIAAVSSWFGGTHADAFSNYAKAVAAKDAGIAPPPGAKPSQIIALCLAVGWVPIYCSDSPATRDKILAAFGERGWRGKPWGEAYATKGFGEKTWWFGATFAVADAPAELAAKARARVGTDYAAGLARTVRFCVDAKGREVAERGREDFDAWMLDAFPVLPPAVETTAPLVRPQVTTALVPSGTPSQAVIPATTPPVEAVVSDVARALDTLTEPGRSGDWLALARMARVIQREGPRSPMARMALALMR